MKKFIINLFIYILIFIIICLLFYLLNSFFVHNQYLGNYQASIIDKVERLKSIDEPKIILVGNSNLSFGINSEKIQKELEMPVVNLGLHGGLGNPFHENIAKLNINKGDIVIVSHTNYDADNITQPDLAWITIEYHRELYQIIGIKDYLSVLKSYPTYAFESAKLKLKKKGNEYKSDTCYSRNSFNEYGDVVVKPEHEDKSIEEILSESKITIPNITDEGVIRLNEFNKYIENKGATLLIAAYPIADGQYTPNKREYVEFEEKLRSKLDCNIISNFTDYFIDYDYFYNTIYHLTEEGANIRTKLLIDDIKRWKNMDY